MSELCYYTYRRKYCIATSLLYSIVVAGLVGRSIVFSHTHSFLKCSPVQSVFYTFALFLLLWVLNYSCHSITHNNNIKNPSFSSFLSLLFCHAMLVSQERREGIIIKIKHRLEQQYFFLLHLYYFPPQHLLQLQHLVVVLHRRYPHVQICQHRHLRRRQWKKNLKLKLEIK